MLPNVGYVPWRSDQKVWELHISHWTGELAKLEVYQDWVYGGRFQEVFGRATYRGASIHGFKTTHSGTPLDTYGRLLYLDTLNSQYGPGWMRENSFVVHNPSGMFCYGFYPYGSYGGYPTQRTEKLAGMGDRYRMTLSGPGVTPDVMWTGDGLADVRLEDPGARELGRADVGEGSRDGRSVRRAAVRPSLSCSAGSARYPTRARRGRTRALALGRQLRRPVRQQQPLRS